MRRVAFVYDDALSRHVYRPDHPLKPVRYRYTYELLEAYGVFRFDNTEVVPPDDATDDDLRLVHDPEYIEAVKSLGRGERRFNPARYNFSDWGDNPVFPGMYEASRLVVGASLKAMELVVEGTFPIAFNIAGGLHHAMPDRASGFCIFNDPAVVIAHLINRGYRVAYIDIDAHHGDGVQYIFYSTDQVLTVSIHESGRFLFPGTGDVQEVGAGRGRGYSVNIPLAPYTDDEVWLWAFDQVVPPLMEAFRPDVVVAQLGVDTHRDDPLTHLALTTHGFIEAVRRIIRFSPRLVALGGGGYNLSVVPRAWTLAYAEFAGIELPDDVPARFHELVGRRLRDPVPNLMPESLRADIRAFAQATVELVKQLIFPIHGL